MQAWMGLFIIFGALRYDAAALASELMEHERDTLLALAVTTSTLLSILTAPVALLIVHLSLDVASRADTTVIFSAAALAGSIYSVATFRNLRDGKFVAVAGAAATQSILVLGIQALSSLNRAGTFWVLASEPISRIASVLLWNPFRSVRAARVIVSSSAREIVGLGRRMRRYPAYAMPGELLQQLNSGLVPLILSATFGQSTAAQFGLMVRSSFAPSQLIARSQGDALAKDFSSEGRAGSWAVRELVVRTWKTNMPVAAAGSFALALFGPELFSFVFGAPWRTAGEFSRFAAPMVFSLVVFTPSLRVLTIVGHKHLQLAWDLTLAVIGLGGTVTVALLSRSPVWTVAYFCSAYAVLLLAHGVLVMHATSRRP